MPHPSHETSVRALPQGVDRLIERALECTNTARIRDLLTEPPVSPSALALCVSFGDDGRARRTLHESERGRVVLFGWMPGRGSAIQSYGHSACVFRVLRGVATEVRYEIDGTGSAVELSRDHFMPGSVVVCASREVHAILNDAAASEPLVALQIQRPAPHATVYPPASMGDVA